MGDGWTPNSRADFVRRLSTVDWSPYWTAYGYAHAQSSYGSIPDLLAELSSDDEKRALTASDSLWASLCHQEIRSSPAAVPALPFLLEAYNRGSAGLRFELLELFKGLAVTSERFPDDAESAEIIGLLTKARDRFEPLLDASDEETRFLAEEILRVTS